MLRLHRKPGQEIAVKREGSNGPDDYIRIKVCDIDWHQGTVEIGVKAGNEWLIYRAEHPRSERTYE